MKDKTKHGFLEDQNGDKSSTRLFSLFFAIFFFVINIMVFLVIMNTPSVLNLNMMLFILIFDFILLLAVFAPKQLGKIEEIKEVIETIKKQNHDTGN
jgi:Ca2+/Na+ antiporter